jgi:hypothetical protein
MPTLHPMSLALATVVLAAGCRPAAEIQPGDIRTYVAPKAVSPLAGATAGSGSRVAPGMDGPTGDRPAGPQVAYDVPEGWVDAGGGGLRLATLRTGPGTGPDVGEVTLIVASGSLEGNVARWQEQLTPGGSAEAVAQAIAAADKVETTGTTATIVLLDDGAEKDRQAILAAMIPLDDSGAIFVKFKGSAERAAAIREPFTALVRSIRLR